MFPTSRRRGDGGGRAGAEHPSQEEDIPGRPPVHHHGKCKISLYNETDEFAALTRHQRERRRSMEMWPTKDPHATIDGCKRLWADRTMESGKRNRLALFVNDRCCQSGHITVKEQLQCSNNELLAVGTRDITCCGDFSNLFQHIFPSVLCLRLVHQMTHRRR